jgi:hypothetical protein
MIFDIKKYCYENTDVEYIVPEDIFSYGNEEDPKLQHLYMFLCTVAKELNYYNNNTSTAFGNPDLEFYRGQIRGWMQAKQWEWDEKTMDRDNVVIFIKTASGRTFMKIEKPKLPNAEKKRRQEIAKDLDALGL